jgi:hypothetical protein
MLATFLLFQNLSRAADGGVATVEAFARSTCTLTLDVREREAFPRQDGYRVVPEGHVTRSFPPSVRSATTVSLFAFARVWV